MPKSEKNGKPVTEARGETARSSYRIPEQIMTKLDELVTAFEDDMGMPQNRTTVLLQLILREHARRAKAKERK